MKLNCKFKTDNTRNTIEPKVKPKVWFFSHRDTICWISDRKITLNGRSDLLVEDKTNNQKPKVLNKNYRYFHTHRNTTNESLKWLCICIAFQNTAFGDN